MKSLSSKFSLLCGVVLACSLTAAPQSKPGDSAHPLAIVAGQPIDQSDLEAELGPRLLQLRNQEYQIKSQALEGLIRKKLLEAEASRRGISTDKLQEEIDSKVPEPTDAEIEGYYLAIRNQLNQPLADVRPNLERSLKALKVQQAREEFADSLRAKAGVVVMLTPPKVEVGYDSARVRGNPAAPVTIVEFSDFQCPYCKKVAGTLKDLLAKYNGRVKLAYRDFPMRQIHPQSQIAAEAARCAEDQGKFWEYHDALFADQSKLDEAGLEGTARSLGLDEKNFHACLSSGKFKAGIERDLQEGSRAGVAGTPGFFINGAFLNGAQPEAEFEKIINAEFDGHLKRSGE